MDLSVVIVSYNARDELARCLDAVLERTKLAAFEVLVADNDSTDGSREMLAERYGGRVRVFPCRENLGFSRASNLCWHEAKSLLVAFLNPDTIVADRALDRLVALLRERPEVGVVGPRLRYESGATQMSFGKTLGIGAEMLQKAWNRGYAKGYGPLRSVVERTYGKEQTVDWVSGACLVTRRDLLETTGGFDENFFLYSEDVDLCERVRAAGFTVVYTPSAEVTHLLGRSAGRDRARALLESHRSRLYFYRKHRGSLELTLLRAYIGAKAAIAFVFNKEDRPVYRSLLHLIRSGVES